MNKLERRMLDILRRGKDEFGFVAVKAEFEAEGARSEEFLRLLEIARKAGVGAALKIGGCEAVRDLIESKQYGVEYVIAPMVETPYALTKFVDAKNKIYSKDEQEDTEFLFNLETVAAFQALDALIAVAERPDARAGVVFGRGDFVLSNRMDRESVNDGMVTDCILKTAAAAKKHNLPLVVGGAVSGNSVDALRRIHKVHLTRFETRKVIFEADRALRESDIHRGLLEALQFELLWLKNKCEHYIAIGREDEERIRTVEARLGRAASVAA